MAPQVGLEPTTTRLTAECSAIELLRIISGLILVLGSRSRPLLRSLAQVLLLISLTGSLCSGFPRSDFTPFAGIFPVIGMLEKLSLLQLPLSGSRRRPTLPGRCQPSTISAKRLNFCVRYGNRWIPPAIVTGNCIYFFSSTPSKLHRVARAPGTSSLLPPALSFSNLPSLP